MAELTFLAALQLALREELARDERVFLMGEDVQCGVFGVTNGLVDEFGPARIRNTPIAEAAMTGVGLGAAIVGARPIVEIEFSTMTYIAMDMIVNQAAKTRYMTAGQATAPMVIRTAICMGFNAGPQHADTPHALFAHSAGIHVAVPGSARSARGLLKTAIRSDDPVIFFEHLSLGATTEEVPAEEELIPFGQALVRRPGDDVTIVAFGGALPPVTQAAERLAGEGVNVEIIDPQTIVPFDWETVFASVRRTGRLVAVDDALPTCSMASEICATVASECFDDLKAAPVKVTRPAVPIPFSVPLEQHVLLSEEKVVSAVARATGSTKLAAV